MKACWRPQTAESRGLQHHPDKCFFSHQQKFNLPPIVNISHQVKLGEKKKHKTMNRSMLRTVDPCWCHMTTSLHLDPLPTIFTATLRKSRYHTSLHSLTKTHFPFHFANGSSTVTQWAFRTVRKEITKRNNDLKWTPPFEKSNRRWRYPEQIYDTSSAQHPSTEAILKAPWQ